MSEARIQREIELALGAEPDLLLLRNNVGLAVYNQVNEHTGKSREQRVAYGLGVGSPDLVGILLTPDGTGVWFCLEVKDVGEEATPDQAKSHAMWRRFGATVEVVHSVDEARWALDATRRAARDL